MLKTLAPPLRMGSLADFPGNTPLPLVSMPNLVVLAQWYTTARTETSRKNCSSFQGHSKSS